MASTVEVPRAADAGDVKASSDAIELGSSGSSLAAHRIFHHPASAHYSPLMAPMYDTIIIGAGMSGLAAGIRLAYYEQRVCILERHSDIGGLNSFYGRARPRLRRRPARDDQLFAAGDAAGPAGPAARQLRFAWEELSLVPQIGSAIMFPGVALEFTNDFEPVRVGSAPALSRGRRTTSAGWWRRWPTTTSSARRRRRRLGPGSRRPPSSHDPLLVEMLFCPVLFYGGAGEHDMDFGQFSILFRSVFLEGLARPLAGMRLILKQLVGKFCELGGELRLRAAREPDRGPTTAGSNASCWTTARELEARSVLSSAGWPETMRLCDAAAAGRPARRRTVDRRVDLGA